MKRLTKEEILQFPNVMMARAIGKTLATKIVSELLEYKNVEENLGIDLITLVKTLKNGIWDNKGRYYNELDLDLPSSCLSYMLNYGNDIEFKYFHFKDYGILWALTKEELE